MIIIPYRYYNGFQTKPHTYKFFSDLKGTMIGFLLHKCGKALVPRSSWNKKIFSFWRDFENTEKI